MLRALVLIATLAAASCVRPLLLTPRASQCADGLPVRVLVAATCPSGICGYSCAPHRWEKTECP